MKATSRHFTSPIRDIHYVLYANLPEKPLNTPLPILVAYCITHLAHKNYVFTYPYPCSLLHHAPCSQKLRVYLPLSLFPIASRTLLTKITFSIFYNLLLFIFEFLLFISLSIRYSRLIFLIHVCMFCYICLHRHSQHALIHNPTR